MLTRSVGLGPHPTLRLDNDDEHRTRYSYGTERQKKQQQHQHAQLESGDGRFEYDVPYSTMLPPCQSASSPRQQGECCRVGRGRHTGLRIGAHRACASVSVGRMRTADARSRRPDSRYCTVGIRPLYSRYGIQTACIRYRTLIRPGWAAIVPVSYPLIWYQEEIRPVLVLVRRRITVLYRTQP